MAWLEISGLRMALGNAAGAEPYIQKNVKQERDAKADCVVQSRCHCICSCSSNGGAITNTRTTSVSCQH